MGNHSDESFIKGVARNQRNYHPFTKEPIALTTSMSSEEPRSGLTSYTVSEVMQGMGSHKPDAIAWDAFNQSMSGDLGHFIRSEGGLKGTLGTRAPLLAHDIMDKTGFDDGTFTSSSSIEIAVSAGISEVTASGQAPAPPPAAGGGPMPPTTPEGKMQWPTAGAMNSGFGPRWGKMHQGIDIAAPQGQPIIAADGGIAHTQTNPGGWGNYVDIDHGNGIWTKYAHMTHWVATNGGAVTRGELIGYVGSTGNSTGPHLHFEVRRGGAMGPAEDPMPWLR